MVAVTDPIYPVYVESNVMAGRGGDLNSLGGFERIVYLSCKAENGFVPELPRQRVDIIYLCYPNNPTGTTLSKTELKKWVDYARENQSVILYDAAYEAFIKEEGVPHSIYEIEGAMEVAIEFRSFSKTAGFTGTRCAYTVVPKRVVGYTRQGTIVSLNQLWNRRQTTKFNGASYIVQSERGYLYREGQRQIREPIDYYMTNASII